MSMFGSKFNEIMGAQPSNLNVYEEQAKMQALVNQSNLELMRYHNGNYQSQKVAEEKST